MSNAQSLFSDDLPKFQFENVEKLLEIKLDINEEEQKLLLNSSLVFAVASWQANIETTITYFVNFIINNVESFYKVPVRTRKKIFASYLKIKKTEKKQDHILIYEATESLISIDEEWQKTFQGLLLEKNKGFNTPNIENINKLFFDILGLDKVEEVFTIEDKKDIEKMLDIRHKIVHGYSVTNFSIDELRICIKLFKKYLLLIQKKCIVFLNDIDGKIYSIRSFKLPTLIKWIDGNGVGKSFSLDDLYHERSWYGNYRKLYYDCWGFLDKDENNIKPTDRLSKFLNGSIKIPEEIKLINKNPQKYIAIPVKDTQYVTWSEIKSEEGK